MAFNTYSINYFVKEHGILMTLNRREQGDYDALTGTVHYSSASYSFYGLSYNSDPYNLTTQNSIVVSSRQIVIPAIQSDGQAIPTPNINDQILINGLTYDILKVSQVKSANKVICYMVSVRN